MRMQQGRSFCLRHSRRRRRPLRRMRPPRQQASLKHQRFSLLTPSSKENPLSVTSARKGELSCSVSRTGQSYAESCDVPLHASNEHTQKHNRVKLSAICSVYASVSRRDSSSDGCGFCPDLKSQTSIKNTCFVSDSKNSPCPDSGKNNSSYFVSGVVAAKISANSGLIVGKDGNGSRTQGSTSSISEYLIEMLPGWHFEDFLDSCSASLGFCKNDSGHSQLIENDIDSEISSFSSESLGIWVPQSPLAPSHPSQFPIPSPQPNLKKGSKESCGAMLKATKRRNNDSFAVPQISSSPSSTEFKRSRQFGHPFLSFRFPSLNLQHVWSEIRGRSLALTASQQ